jgi:diphthamide synthase (EF-2-diphthine--ammonia ligase)
VTALLSTVNAAADRVAMHAVRRSLLEAQANRLGLPLVVVERLRCHGSVILTPAQ